MAGVVSRILRISIRLVVDALAVVGAGCSVTLLFCCRLLVWVAERLSHRLVVVGADHLSSESSDATSHRTLGQTGETMVLKIEVMGRLSIPQENNDLRHLKVKISLKIVTTSLAML